MGYSPMGFKTGCYTLLTQTLKSTRRVIIRENKDSEPENLNSISLMNYINIGTVLLKVGTLVKFSTPLISSYRNYSNISDAKK